MYDAERDDLNGRWFKYKTEVFYGVHKQIGSFKHRTELGGYLGSLLRVLWHKLFRPLREEK